MATQLELWNLAAAHVGATEAITDIASRQRAAVECAKFELIARDIVLSEWPWSFAAGEVALVDEIEPLDVSQLIVREDADTTLWFWLSGDAALEDYPAGTTVTLNGTTAGYTFDDYDFIVGVDADDAKVLLLTDGTTNAYATLDALLGSTTPANGATFDVADGTVNKRPVTEAWAYQYALPSDFVVARNIYSESYQWRPDMPPIPFEIVEDTLGARVLLTDLDGAILRYTKAPASYSAMPRTLLLALSYKLAELIAFPVTRDAEIETRCTGLYMRALHSAIEKDGNSQKPDRDPRGESMREGFSDFGGGDDW